MAVRDILKMGDARLLRVAQPVVVFDTPELKSLVSDLFETMKAAGGVGIAAPQIGVNLQVVVFGFGYSENHPDSPSIPETVLINPCIEPLSVSIAEDWEGCLSVPGMRGLVARHEHIRYTGADMLGAPFTREVSGFHARLVQHECDHLIGRLYPTRIRDMTRFGFTEVLFPTGQSQQPE